MIVQIDHVAVSSPDLDGDLDAFGRLGYRADFVEKGVPNCGNKKGLMKEFSEMQSLALLRSGSSIPFELLDHGHVNVERSSLLPIFDNLPDEMIKSRCEGGLDGEISRVVLAYSGLPACVSKTVGGAIACDRMVALTRDVEASALFWKNFGFRVLGAGRSSALLEFSSLFTKKKYRMNLQQEDGFDGICLDDRGYNCLAFVSNSAARERENLAKKGIDVTGIDELTLNGKRMSVFFATGPSGELVEIVNI